MAAALPQAVEILQHQLAAAGRDQWKALRGAIDLLAPSARISRRRSRGRWRHASIRSALRRPIRSRKTARFSLDSMSLVADDEVQEEIAIGNATRRLREQLGEELFALTQRLAAADGRRVAARRPAQPGLPAHLHARPLRCARRGRCLERRVHRGLHRVRPGDAGRHPRRLPRRQPHARRTRRAARFQARLRRPDAIRHARGAHGARERLRGGPGRPPPQDPPRPP